MRTQARLVLLALLLQPGCARPLKGRVRVAHPFAVADGPAAATIRIGDARAPTGLAWPGADGPERRSTHAGIPNVVEPRWLDQDAWLERACADELVFDLRLSAEWEELARVGDYEIGLEDDRGARWTPAEIASTAGTSRSVETTYQRYKAVQRASIGGDGNQVWTMWVPEQQPVRQQIYFGGGAVQFRAPGILRPDTRALTLTLRSRARTLRFTFDFEPGPALAQVSTATCATR